MLVFPWQKIELEGGRSLRRPVVPVIMVGERASMQFPALIDSGADVSVIRREIADFLGINYALSGSQFVMAGAVIGCAEARCSFVLEARRKSERLDNVPVLVALDDVDFDVVLGCAGVFDAFRITFDQRKSIRMKRISELLVSERFNRFQLARPSCRE